MNYYSLLGLQFEDIIHNLISQCEYKVLRKKEIKNKYSSIAYGIDHLILANNFVIIIQDKPEKIKTNITRHKSFYKSIIKNKYCRRKKILRYIFIANATNIICEQSI